MLEPKKRGTIKNNLLLLVNSSPSHVIMLAGYRGLNFKMMRPKDSYEARFKITPITLLSGSECSEFSIRKCIHTVLATTPIGSGYWCVRSMSNAILQIIMDAGGLHRPEFQND